MGHQARMLLIGTDALRDSVARALPDCTVAMAEHPLDGVWKCGQQEFDGVLVSLTVGSKALRAIESLRRVSPDVRIVVGCCPADEPVARRALEAGADDYVLEPVSQQDLQSAFHLTPLPPLPAADATPGPTLQEIVELGDLLRHLDDGTGATLDRLASLLQNAFDAIGAVIQLDDLACTTGDASVLVLEEIIRRHDRPVGRVALARRTRGSYTASTAARLAEYARLVDIVITQTRDQQRWRELAWSDDLSQLHNRRYFEQVLEQLIERAVDKRLRLTVLLFDIDDFKSYNDRYGHETGDKLIREVADLLRHCTRDHDVVVRYGGDEFAVVFWDAEGPRVRGSEHPREPIQLATRFCKAIAQHNFECLGADAPGPVTISGGLACFPHHGGDRAQLLAAADEALLAAKRTGKNRIRLAGKNSENSPP